ncbi:Diaminopimelate epimerase [Candidatus Magnetomoraceae bacterium gMMP-15]
MKINILKCHGSGNDLILVDEYNNNYLFSDKQRKILTVELCHKSKGIGADGILFYQKSKIANCRMRMFNPDGSEAEMCGNGIRCIARYCYEKEKIDLMNIETMNKVLSVKRIEDIFKDVTSFETEISPISLKPESLPMKINSDVFIDSYIKELSPDLKFTALSVPNPHIVSIVDKIDENELISLGEKANTSLELFPKGVNVSLCKILDKKNIFVVTSERGVGITYSCGTGMSASCLVSCLSGFVNSNEYINIFNKGGMVKCLITGNSNELNKIKLAGNATFVFTSTIEFDFSIPGCGKGFKKELFINEINYYDNLLNFVKKQLKNYDIAI